MTIVLDGTSGITSPNETTGVLTATSINASGAITAASVTTTGATGSLNSINTFGFKNRIINGNMAIDQRNAGASISNNTSATQYSLDRWLIYGSVASKFTAQQNAGAITPPTGFKNYLGCTSSSAYSVIASDNFVVTQRIEGYNFADMNWGTASAASVTLSFWVRSSLTGTFGGAIFNSAGTRSYPFSYSIPVANTWTNISITIAGETTGVWSTDNSVGLNVNFSLGSSSALSGTAGSWANTLYTSATGAVSVVGTSGATFYITGVQLEKGSTATSFDQRAYSQELAMCQRYYEIQGQCAYSGGVFATFKFSVQKRATPTLGTTPSGGAYTSGPNVDVTGYYAAYNVTSGFIWTASAEL